MKLHIKNGRFIDPRSGTDAKQDVYIAAGRVVFDGSFGRKDDDTNSD